MERDELYQKIVTIMKECNKEDLEGIVNLVEAEIEARKELVDKIYKDE